MLLHALLAGVKIARAADRYQEDALYEQAVAEARVDRMMAESGFEEILAELSAGCAREVGGALVLVGHDPATTEIDGVKALAGAAAGPTALVGVCGGRHVVGGGSGTADAPRATAGGPFRGGSTPPGARADAPFPVVVYPRELVAVRRGPSGWERMSRADTEGWERAVHGQEAPLFDYFRLVASVRHSAGAAKRRREVMEAARSGVDSLVAKVACGVAPESLRPHVAELGALLVGVPLGQAMLHELVRVIGYQAWEIAAAGHADRARLACQLGLAILPDDPSLSALLASMWVDAGRLDEARASLAVAESRPLAITDQARALAEDTRTRAGA
ncbi:MAG: hypothetical protein JNL38_39690 [Myxococcales bacterium]|nr:hypothetical protein [Myxococcales bacterium]